MADEKPKYKLTELLSQDTLEKLKNEGDYLMLDIGPFYDSGCGWMSNSQGQLRMVLSPFPKTEYPALGSISEAFTKSKARDAMKQAFPKILDLLQDESFSKVLEQSGFKWDTTEIFKQMMELCGWKFAQPFIVKKDSVKS